MAYGRCGQMLTEIDSRSMIRWAEKHTVFSPPTSAAAIAFPYATTRRQYALQSAQTPCKHCLDTMVRLKTRPALAMKRIKIQTAQLFALEITVYSTSGTTSKLARLS